MRDIILVIDVLSAVGLVVLVLLQQGKGADMGAAFGARRIANALRRARLDEFSQSHDRDPGDGIFLSNMALAWVATREQKEAASVTRSVTEIAPTPVAPIVPAVPAPDKVPEVPK